MTSRPRILLVILVVVTTGFCYVMDNVNDPGGNDMVCTSEPIDLALVLDVSSSMRVKNKEKWKQMKKFVKRYLKYYDISEKGTHVAITTYGDDAIVDINFDRGTNAAILDETIDHLRENTSNTYIDRGLRETYQKVFTKNNSYMRSKNVTKVLVLFTDGYQTEDGEYEPPENEAHILKKDRGVIIYTVGVGELGKEIDEKQLQKIATNKSYYFHAETFDDLTKVAEKLINKQCKLVPKPTTPKPTPKKVPCPRPVDVALILDSSNSIGTSQWKDEVRFAKRIVDCFKVGPKDSHVAIIRYNADPKLVMSFKEGQQSNEDVTQRIEKFEKYIYTKANYSKGLTFIDKALEMANSQVFTEAGGMRSDVKKVCIIMTDGMQTNFKVAYTPPSKAVVPLKRKGVEVFTVGITGDIDVDELVKTASLPDHCFSTEYFYELEKKAKEIGMQICEVYPV